MTQSDWKTLIGLIVFVVLLFAMIFLGLRGRSTGSDAPRMMVQTVRIDEYGVTCFLSDHGISCLEIER